MGTQHRLPFLSGAVSYEDGCPDAVVECDQACCLVCGVEPSGEFAAALAANECLFQLAFEVDVFGTRRVFLTGLAVFCAANLAGGLATGPGLLVAARAAQGMGAAVLAPATLTLVTTTYPEGPRRTRALASWTAVSVAGGTVGNLLGGALTGALSWRWTLLINVPVGVVAVVLAARALPSDRRRVSAVGCSTPH